VRARTLEHVVRSVLPDPARRAIKTTVRSIQRRTHAGDGVVCPVCDGQFRAFLPRYGRPNRQCPACHSLVRHRSLWLFLRDRLAIGDGPRRVLHFAPERGIATRIGALSSIDYTTADIDAALASERVDITAMPYLDASFDVVICSHVLEHVPDDRTAIAEMHRVLKPGGQAIVVVPIKTGLTEEFLDPSSTPAFADGYRRSGGHGHVRRIGADYTDRLRASGFDVEVVDYVAELSDDDRERYALEPGEVFFRCTRADTAA